MYKKDGYRQRNVRQFLQSASGTLFGYLTRVTPVCHCLQPLRLQASPGSVTDTEYRGISKCRYRSRYSKYRKIQKKKYRKKNDKSVFQFCKYNPLVIRVYARSGQIPRSVYSVILHKIVMTIQCSLS